MSTPKKSQKAASSLPSATPREVRANLADSLEDIGSAMGLLREAVNDADSGNVQGGKLCASDALEILSILESKFSQMAATLARWSEATDDQCVECGTALQLVRPGKHQCPHCA